MCDPLFSEFQVFSMTNWLLILTFLKNIFEGISELRVYYKQFFTNNLPWSSENLYRENMIRGAKVGIKINKFLSGIIDIHDVFYDQDLDGVVDRIRMSSFELQVRL